MLFFGFSAKIHVEPVVVALKERPCVINLTGVIDGMLDHRLDQPLLRPGISPGRQAAKLGIGQVGNAGAETSVGLA